MRYLKEIDKIIAEEIFKWTNVKFKTGGNIYFGEPDDDYNKDYPSNKHSIRVPLWSSYGSTALELVERMRFLGWCIKMKASNSGNYRVNFYDLDYPGFGSNAPTLELAICEAAIRTIRENQGEIVI